MYPMVYFLTWLRTRTWLRSREGGQGLVEYALILVLVSIVVIATLTLLGPKIKDIFQQIANALTPAT